MSLHLTEMYFDIMLWLISGFHQPEEAEFSQHTVEHIFKA